MKIDYIPIYKGEKLPTKEEWFHSEGKLPPRIANKEHFRNRMIEEALHSDYLRDCDLVIIVENGQVIEIYNNGGFKNGI